MTRWNILLALGIWVACQARTDNHAWSTSLFRCVTEANEIVYTDTPTQLQQCIPIPTSGSVTSLETTSSGVPAPGPLLDYPTPPPALLQPQTAPSPEGSSPTFVGTPASAVPNPLPCPVGINPLNPFTNPPCPSLETASPAPTPMPLMPGTMPTIP